MGRWRIPGDGSGVTAMARGVERDFTERLLDRIFARGAGGARGTSHARMEVDVLAGCTAGLAGTVYPDEGAGVRGLGATSRRKLQGIVASGGAERETLQLPGGADDVHDVFVAR